MLHARVISAAKDCWFVASWTVPAIVVTMVACTLGGIGTEYRSVWSDSPDAKYINLPDNDAKASYPTETTETKSCIFKAVFLFLSANLRPNPRSATPPEMRPFHHPVSQNNALNSGSPGQFQSAWRIFYNQTVFLRKIQTFNAAQAGFRRRFAVPVIFIGKDEFKKPYRKHYLWSIINCCCNIMVIFKPSFLVRSIAGRGQCCFLCLIPDFPDEMIGSG